jgi:SLOG cluster3 family
MLGPVFLSASVPDPSRDPRYFRSADVIAIRDSVRALVTVALPLTTLVWGGHPAITPMVRIVAESLGLTQSDRIILYQSAFFAGQMPIDNAVFQKVIETPAVGTSKDRSIKLMRDQMINSLAFMAGVFIGGMEGVDEEYRLFRHHHPGAIALPVASTGGAALEVYRRHEIPFPADLETDLAYPSLFRRLLQLPRP